MKKYLGKFLVLVVGVMGLVGKGEGQNLVENASFESVISCVYPNLGIHDTEGWSNPTAYSPDYFNSCVPDLYNHHSDVPLNYYGSQEAHSGNAYTGIITGYFGFDGREYIQSKLLDSLQYGYEYCVSFYVCLCDSSPFAVNNIGVFFSDTSLFLNTLSNLPFTPQIANDPVSNPLNLRNTWINVADTFIASGGEQYIVIGNFKNDFLTDTSHDGLGGNLDYGYDYVDDVSVEKCDNPNAITNSKRNSFFQISPNPFTTQLQIHYTITLPGELMVYDALCRKVKSNALAASQNTFELSVAELPAGVYLVAVNSGGRVVGEMVVKE